MLIMTMTRLQMNLKFLGLYSGEIDGIKGTQTINAIKEFQKDNNLKVDGIAGQKTIDSLRSQIIDIQKQLGVTLDGVAGTETITAFNNKVESLYGKSWDSIKQF